MKTRIFTENGLNLVELSSDAATVSIAIDHGALLHAFVIRKDDSVLNVIDGYADEADARQHLSESFKGAKLSPFVGRLAGGRYQYEGEDFEIMSKKSLHGLLYDQRFTVVDQFADEHQAAVLLKFNYHELDAGYPFRFRCEVRYVLTKDALLQVHTTILNLDDLPIPIADGWHPYFNLSAKVDELTLFINSAARFVMDEALVPAGGMERFDAFAAPALIGSHQLNDCFLLEESATVPACILRNDKLGVQVNIYPDASYPYMLAFTPPQRDSIALECVSAPPNAFNNQLGLLLLQPRRSQSFTVHYKAAFD